MNNQSFTKTAISVAVNHEPKFQILGIDAVDDSKSYPECPEGFVHAVLVQCDGGYEWIDLIQVFSGNVVIRSNHVMVDSKGIGDFLINGDVNPLDDPITLDELLEYSGLMVSELHNHITEWHLYDLIVEYVGDGKPVDFCDYVYIVGDNEEIFSEMRPDVPGDIAQYVDVTDWLLDNVGITRFEYKLTYLECSDSYAVVKMW